MSRDMLEVAGLRRRSWSLATRADRAPIRWWPTTLPGSDLDQQPRRRVLRPARKPLRRGRILLVAA